MTDTTPTTQNDGRYNQPRLICVPKPLYGCHNEGCATECSYPADMLYWYDGVDPLPEDDRPDDFQAPYPGWYCDACFDEELLHSDRGVTLADFLLLDPYQAGGYFTGQVFLAAGRHRSPGANVGIIEMSEAIDAGRLPTAHAARHFVVGFHRATEPF